jgi:hypothetical protein
MAVVRLEANMSRVSGVTGMSDVTIVNNVGCECRGEQEGSDGCERSSIDVFMYAEGILNE